MPPDGAAGHESSITLHSSWKGVVVGGMGALVVFGVGLAVTISSGGAPISVIILALGTLLLGTTLFDYPVASRFDAEGVERRALLRRHRLSWDRVDQLTRTRPGLRARTLTPGGLAAKVGRRRYLLVDQCESVAEFDELGEILAARYAELGVDEMITPRTDTDPTWTYRRKQWQR